LLNVKLKLKNSILPFQLQGVDRENLSVIVSLNEFRATDPQFVVTRLYAVVLHPSR
jgi:hypothetical protein